MKNKRKNIFSLSEIHEYTYRHSSNLSTVARQLVFAEGAIIWALLVKYDLDVNFTLISLYLCLIIFLILDFSQYYVLTKKLSKVAGKMKKNKIEEISRDEINMDCSNKLYKAKISFIFVSTIIFFYSTIQILAPCTK